MIKYGLKEENLLNKLDEWNGWLFRYKLRQVCENHYQDDSEFVVLEVGRLRIPKSEISVDAQYDPRSWNEYPQVTPPDGIAMRVELLETRWAGENKIGILGYFFNGDWYCKAVPFNGETLYQNKICEKVLRFKPWDDEPEEDEEDELY